MEITLDRRALEWQTKARTFAEQELQPWELEAEFNNGVIPAEVRQRHRQLAIELGFSRMDVPERYGGLELGMTEQVAVWEQLGAGDQCLVLVLFRGATMDVRGL